MGSEDLAKRRKNERTTRISKEQELRAETWLIVCEGTKTEPKYFTGLLDYVNTLTDKKIKFKVVGTGRNTESLVNSVDDLFNFTDKEISIKKIKYGKTFIVFDKDDFTKSAFNNAVRMCIRKGYVSLWSNECIELWFLLHFDYLESAISRKEYFKKLTKKLKVEYKKNVDNFSLLGKLEKIPKAYKYAKKLGENLNCEAEPADRKPCTMLYKIIDEIEEYLSLKLK